MVLVEGVGGWRVPLGRDGAVSDLAVALGLPVVLVVGLRLGCINHAVLSAESILASGLTLAGWVANIREPEMAELEGNVTTLERVIDAPCLGQVPHLEILSAEAVAERLSNL
jgi:dethiobiotin synthetase